MGFNFYQCLPLASTEADCRTLDGDVMFPSASSRRPYCPSSLFPRTPPSLAMKVPRSTVWSFETRQSCQTCQPCLVPQLVSHGSFCPCPSCLVPQLVSHGSFCPCPSCFVPQLVSHGSFCPCPSCPVPKLVSHGSCCRIPSRVQKSRTARGPRRTLWSCETRED